MSRVRIIVGREVSPFRILLATAIIVLYWSIATPDARAESISPRLITGTANGYTTTIAASSATGGLLVYSDSPLIPPYVLQPHGNVRIIDIAGWQSHRGFGSMPLVDGNVDAYSLLSYGTTQFKIPALRFAVFANGQKGEIQKIANYGANGTFVVLLNLSDTPAAITLDAYDGDNVLKGTETVTAQPGITPYTLATVVTSGRLEITEGYKHFNSPPDATVLAFACVGPASGASQDCEVMGPIQ